MPVNVRRRLQEIGIATASAARTASVVIGPVPVHCKWLVDQVSIQLSTGTGLAQMNHGANTTAPILLDATQLAAQNRTSPPSLELYPGEVFSVTFSKLAAGAGVTVSMRGRQVPFP